MSDVDLQPRVLVTGATGYVGGRLVPELLDQGIAVRAVARVPEKLNSRSFARHPLLQIVQADVIDPVSLDAALQGIRVAYYLVHSMRAGDRFHEIDMQAARTFASACRAHGVEQIIYLSGLGEGDDERLSTHLASRHDTGAALREAGVPVTELRAAIIVGSGGISFEIIHDLARKLPVMVAPRWIDTPCEPIAIRDVVHYLIGVAEASWALGETFEIGGGEVLRYSDMLRECAHVMGRTVRILTVPVLTPGLSSYWLHLVTSADMSIARPLVEGMGSRVVCADTRIRDLLPLELTTYRRSLELALERSKNMDVRWSHWTDASAHAPAPQRYRYQYRDYRTFEASMSADELFARVEQVGGANGYGGSVDLLWKIRGALDRMLGGPGLRRGRPAGALAVGDPVDFWRVSTLEPGSRIVLEAEMLVPGEAQLELSVEATGPHTSRLHQLATLRGDQQATRLYWNTIKPVHGLVFRQMGRALISRPARDAAG